MTVLSLGTAEAASRVLFLFKNSKTFQVQSFYAGIFDFSTISSIWSLKKDKFHLFLTSRLAKKIGGNAYSPILLQILSLLQLFLSKLSATKTHSVINDSGIAQLRWELKVSRSKGTNWEVIPRCAKDLVCK